MSTLTPLTELSDRDLMEQLRANPGKTRLVREVERRTGAVIQAAVATFEDAEAAYWEALHEVTRITAVDYFLDQFCAEAASQEPGAVLRKFAYGRSRSTPVHRAGLVGEKQRKDAAYGNRAMSIDAAREAHGFDLYAPAEPLSDVERAWNTRVIRESFQTIAREPSAATGLPVLTEKQIAAVLTLGNLHRDDALPEMNKHDAAAKTMRITRATFEEHLCKARAAAANHPVLSIAIFELCGGEDRNEPHTAMAVAA
ncbi:hypothetical protein [Microbacterium suwonense]|uniref:Uncharacterized protein n=1 Tax=Microbacterium suwonense TaxID=683047 RepID=A0ABN6X7C3_9MICO|nr:hypothetical protein [Microbacterium suwonense]BDZ39917.1 hypothetical protein GCM10025863_25310 [Microbacterium suwonense]